MHTCSIQKMSNKMMHAVFFHTGECLTDKHINFAEKLLSRQFKSISGLRSTLTLSKSKRLTAKSASNALQILHCKGCHWIAASTINTYPKVAVYDSLYSSIDEATVKILRQMFGAKAEIELKDGPKQDGTSDCGLFAIATCVSLASDGTLPSEFEQSEMRQHLIKCFEQLNFEPFPIHSRL